GTRFYPPWVKDLLARGERLPRAVVPIEDQAAWWGTQAVLMTRRVVEQVLAWESDGAGWDIHLRNGALHTGTKIHTLIPNPVQHRGVPSLALARPRLLSSRATPCPPPPSSTALCLPSRPSAAAAAAGPLPTTGPSKESTCESSARGAPSRPTAPARRRPCRPPAAWP